MSIVLRSVLELGLLRPYVSPNGFALADEKECFILNLVP